jgi:hypothetical protein
VSCSDPSLIPCSLVDKYLGICLSAIYKTERRWIAIMPSSVRTTTMCEQLIPGMALWKQNLLTCELAASVAFEILSMWKKLCTSWDYGITAETILPNRFPEYPTVTLSRCVGCQEWQQIFVISGHFLVLEKKRTARGGGGVNLGE